MKSSCPAVRRPGPPGKATDGLGNLAVKKTFDPQPWFDYNYMRYATESYLAELSLLQEWKDNNKMIAISLSHKVLE